MRPTRRAVLAGAGTAATTLAAAAPVPAEAVPARRVEVFGHRGACAWFPEHTVASYLRAVADGADYVEPDLCITRDGVLVVRHENDMSETTDVSAHPEFAGRRTRKTVDGEAVTGWFTEDFTLAEIKTLRAKERLPKVRPANTAWDGAFQVVTFEEMLEVLAAEGAQRGRPVGVVPELKHSTYFAARGLPLEDRFLDVLARHRYTRTAPVEIQSFEVANLNYLRSKLGRPANVRLMQLTGDPRRSPADVAAAGGSTTWAQITGAQGLVEVKRYADVVAPNARAVIPLGPDGRLAAPTPLVRDAHAAGLLVHVWTFRPENVFLAADFRDGAGEDARNPEGSVAEMRRYLTAGIDGLFSDDPGLARRAVELSTSGAA